MKEFRINQPIAFDSLGRAWCGRVHAKHLNGELTVRVQLEANPFLLVVKPEMLRPLDSYEWNRLPKPRGE